MKFTFDSLMFWSGVVAWQVPAVLLVWFIGEALWAAVVAASWVRFAWLSARRGGMPVFPNIWKAPWIFLTRCKDFMWFRYGEMTFRNDNGWWEGPGRWKVIEKGERRVGR